MEKGKIKIAVAIVISCLIFFGAENTHAVASSRVARVQDFAATQLMGFLAPRDFRRSDKDVGTEMLDKIPLRGVSTIDPGSAYPERSFSNKGVEKNALDSGDIRRDIGSEFICDREFVIDRERDMFEDVPIVDNDKIVTLPDNGNGQAPEDGDDESRDRLRDDVRDEMGGSGPIVKAPEQDVDENGRWPWEEITIDPGMLNPKQPEDAKSIPPHQKRIANMVVQRNEVNKRANIKWRQTHGEIGGSERGAFISGRWDFSPN